MLKLRTDDKLYIIELLLMFGVCLNMMLRNDGTVSQLFKLTFILLVIAFLLQLYHNQKVNELHLLAAGTILLAFVHVLAGSDTNAFGYYKKLIMFSCTVLMIPFVDGMRVKRWMVNTVLLINIGIALLYPILYWGYGVRGWRGEYLTFNYTNPNLTAMYMMHSLLYCVLAFYYVRHWLAKTFMLVLCCVLFWFDYQTKARSTFVALFAFAFFSFANIVLKKDIKISPKISAILLWSPLFLALGYLFVNRSGLLDRLFSFMDLGEGKPLDARVEIWNRALDAVTNHPIRGSYYDISYGTGASQLHNTHLDTMASYGIVPMVLFVSLLQRGVKKILPTATTNFTRMCLFGFYAVIIQGTFEAALVSGGVGLYLMSFGFLVLAKYNGEMRKSSVSR